jgi:HlyD family secretion protein
MTNTNIIKNTVQNKKKPLKRIYLVILSIIGIALIIFIATIIIRARNQVNTAAALQTSAIGRGSLTATVGATGTVRAEQTALLTWLTSGTVGVVNVKVGDQVNAGDILASLLQTSLSQNVVLAQADLVTAQRNLDTLLKSNAAQAQAQVNFVNAQKAYNSANATLNSFLGYNHGGTTLDVQNAQAQVTLAQKSADQAQQMYDAVRGLDDTNIRKAQAITALYNAKQALQRAQNTLDVFLLVPSGSDVDLARAKLALASAQLEDAKKEWDRLRNGPDPNDIAAAQARVDAAQATINLSLAIAPFAGTVTEANPLAGDQVSPGVSSFRIDNLGSLLVDVQVSEVDINSVQVGQPVEISFDAVQGSQYKGEVTSVASVGTAVQGVVNFTVTVQLDNTDSAVKPGMTAAVTITVKQLDGVLLVPNRAVRLVNNQRVVYVLRNGQSQEIPITLGASAETMSEVLSGDLKEGDLVILNPPSNLFNQRNGPPSGGNGPFGGGL